ncbi:MAG: SCO family protein [bacterium]|nr:SCO family protein [bacterium]
MSKHSQTKMIFGLFIPIGLVMALIAYFVVDRAKESVSDLPVIGEIPQFVLLASDSTAFGTEELKGKLSVVDFIFTHCKGPCPVMSANMAELYDKFDGHPEIQFVSITVDPLTDSLGVMQEYAANFGVDDKRWRFLTGQIEDIAELCEKGFLLAADDLPGNHSTKFVLLDDQARIRGYYDGRDPASMTVLTTHIQSLARQLP